MLKIKTSNFKIKISNPTLVVCKIDSVEDDQKSHEQNGQCDKYNNQESCR